MSEEEKDKIKEEIKESEVEKTEEIIDETDVVEETADEEKENQEKNEYEEKARRLGWVPKKDFRGKESDWRDAKTFVEKGEREIPLLKSSIRRAEETNKYLKDHVKKQSDKIKILSEQLLKQREYELNKRENRAVEESDLQEMDAIRKEREEYYQTKTKLEEQELEKQEQKQDNVILPEVLDWVERNKWFKEDRKKQAYAISTYEEIKKSNPYLSETEVLNQVDQEMNNVFFKKRVPSKTLVTKARSTAIGNNKPKKSIKDLDFKEQEIARNLIRDGTFKNEEEYMKEYELLSKGI